MNKDEGTTSGPWTIEPAAASDHDGDEIVRVGHERNVPIYVERGELADLIGALMVYLDVRTVEAQ